MNEQLNFNLFYSTLFLWVRHTYCLHPHISHQKKDKIEFARRQIGIGLKTNKVLNTKTYSALNRKNDTDPLLSFRIIFNFRFSFTFTSLIQKV